MIDGNDMNMNIPKNVFEVFNAVNDAVIVEKNNIVLFANNSATELFSDDIEGKDIIELLPEDICNVWPKLNCRSEAFITIKEKDGKVTVSLAGDIRIFTISMFGEQKLKDDLVSVMGKAMRAPYANIMIATELMYSGDLLIGEETGQAIGMFVRDTMRMMRIAQNVQLLSEFHNGTIIKKTEQIDLLRLCAGVVGTAMELAQERGVEVSFVSELRELPVVADKYLIEILLLNLLSNAIKFSGYGGKTVVSLSSTGKSIRLTVSDNGIGIAADMLNKIFVSYDELGSNKRVGTGAGVGLALVSAVARLHGGVALVESKEGKGTSVTVMLATTLEDGNTGNNAPCRNDDRESYKGRQLILIQLSDALGFKCFDPLYMW